MRDVRGIAEKIQLLRDLIAIVDKLSAEVHVTACGRSQVKEHCGRSRSLQANRSVLALSAFKLQARRGLEKDDHCPLSELTKGYLSPDSFHSR